MPRFVLLMCLMAVVFAMCVSNSLASLTVVPLGDSITSGYIANISVGPGYRGYLLNQLTSEGIAIQYQGVLNNNDASPNTSGYSQALESIGQGGNDGFSGYGAQDLLNNIAGSANSMYSPNYNAGGYWITGGGGTARSAVYPDIVLLMVGTNDSGYSDGLSRIETGVGGLLNWFAVNRPNTEVIVAAPPPVASGYALNVMQAEDTWLHSLIPSTYPQDHIAEVLSGFLNPDGSVNQSMISGDGIHPSALGYQEISGAFNAAIVASVPEPASLALVSVVALAALRRRSLERGVNS